MFLFSCCTEGQGQDVYELRTKKNNKLHYSVMKSFDPRTQNPIGSQTQVLKVKKSDYQQLLKVYKTNKQMWEDQEFPPNHNSLGQIEGIKAAPWKRLSSIIANPVLFDGRIQPQDAIQGTLGDCYFLSAVSALAERQERITAIFGEQEGVRNGIYKVTLRINGVIEEILVDDYVPVNSKGEPIFCQPNKNEIWVPILEKAWAKANGSYANIVAGSPSEIFRAATYAPAETIDTGGKEEAEGLWRLIVDNARLNRPCCCGTDDRNDVDWQALKLVPGHAYTLIDATELETHEGSRVRILKLRNPWGNTEWEGEGCEADTKFWSSIVSGQSKNNFLKDLSVNNDGIFYILFRDYCLYFAQTHVCYMQVQGNYLYDNFLPSPKRGLHWSILIFQQGQYWLQLHQGNKRKEEQDESVLARATLLIAKNKEPSGYQFINGALSQYRQDCSLRIQLGPGKYTVFAKFDVDRKQEMPVEASISVYSLYYVLLDRANLILAKPMLKECLLSHARATKRLKYENDTMWISWKLMYREGGYAYICFGAQQNAKHKWVVVFNQSDFAKQHFKLKKPFKRRGEGQSFEVKPGQENIIIARVKNDNPTNLKFPPKLTYKVHLLP